MEQEAYPTLDKLTSVLSTLNLERVRQIKSRLIEISGRVQKVERINGSEPKKKKKISLQYGLIHCDDRTSPLLIYTLDYTKELYYNNVFIFFFTFNCGHTHLQVKDELEHLLDDDEDMAEMYLTEKLVYGSNMNEGDDMDDESSQSNFDDRHVIAPLPYLSYEFQFFICFKLPFICDI